MATRTRKPGSGPLAEKRHHYLRLVSQGKNNSEACRIVGVDRKTGVRWRHGRTVKTKHGLRRYEPIAAALGRSPSTISRELRDNSDPVTGSYVPYAAHQRAASRRPRPKDRKIAGNAQLRGYVQRLLDKRWSPEQIAAWLGEQFAENPEMRLCHETIYRILYDREKVLRLQRASPLRSKRVRRKPRHRATRRQLRFPKARPITERAAAAADRSEAGHLEGDLIMGEGNRTAIGTLVCRQIRYTKLIHLPHGKTAEHLHDALTAAVAELPPQLRRTITWDQGSEIGCHQQITDTTGIAVFLCDKASPWQRPTNENTNGLLRDYFPKGSDLSVYTADDLANVERELNQRPRKVLGWRSPEQMLATLT